MSRCPDPALGACICAALRQQVIRLGLSIDLEPDWSAARFVDTVDPYSQEVSQVGTWSGQARYGTVTLFPDGRIFAEYQVLLPHPEQAGVFVESVQVWGMPPDLRGEAVLTALPG